MDKIKEHYKNLARTLGLAKDLSMKDLFTKDAEIKEIKKYLEYLLNKKNNSKIVELGCGNGFTAELLSTELDINIIGIDYCEELIEIAKKRKSPKVNFCVGNVLKLDFKDRSLDIIYTERCLINLDTWQKQKKALDEIHRVLKKGGVFIMLESFLDGLWVINEAREVVGLSPIEQPFHNKYFEKDKLFTHLKEKFIDLGTKDPHFNKIYNKNFLSSYYFGSRVLYPALIKNEDIRYNNRFIEFFSFLKPYGNYSYIQILVFQKN
jgi:ubiquinone/menaquinone biosynthesis C-methylase UbiE